MRTVPATLVTIVAEAILRERLVQMALDSGASGYTLVECSGRGSRGLRSTTPVGGRNVRIEVVTSTSAAERLLARCSEYFPNYAVVVWTAPVHVVRAEKFGAQ